MSDWRPRPWTTDELEEDRAHSLRLLNESAMALHTALDTYQLAVETAEPTVRELFDRSMNLVELAPESIGNRADLLAIARFLASPPLSHDNLKRLIGKSIGATHVASAVIERAVEIISLAIDRTRFPWVADGRQPTTAEIDAARLATLTLVATERARTLQRNDARRLELLSSQALEDGGLVHHPGRPRLLPWSIPAGSYTHEARVAGTNCDRPAHVKEHEVAFLIECKASSTTINGTKRLKSIKEAAATWRRSFGDQVITVAVIAGAFNLEDLRATQADGVFIVWEHRMEPLTELTLRVLGR